MFVSCNLTQSLFSDFSDPNKKEKIYLYLVTSLVLSDILAIFVYRISVTIFHET